MKTVFAHSSRLSFRDLGEIAFDRVQREIRLALTIRQQHPDVPYDTALAWAARLIAQDKT